MVIWWTILLLVRCHLVCTAAKDLWRFATSHRHHSRLTDVPGQHFDHVRVSMVTRPEMGAAPSAPGLVRPRLKSSGHAKIAPFKAPLQTLPWTLTGQYHLLWPVFNLLVRHSAYITLILRTMRSNILFPCV